MQEETDEVDSCEAIESTPLLKNVVSGSSKASSKRLPFHIHKTPSSSNLVDQHRSLHTRVTYYSRLMASSAEMNMHALAIPDHVVPTGFFLLFPPLQIVDSQGRQPSYVTVIAIWNTMMGTSLLTMPWAFGQAGFASGIIIMILMAALSFYTAYRCLTLQSIFKIDGPTHEIGQLCRQIFAGHTGVLLESIAVLFSVITLLGAMIVYWVLMSNFLFNTGKFIAGLINHNSVNNNLSDDEVVCPSNHSLNLVYNEGHLNKWWSQFLTVPLYLALPFIFLTNLKNPKIFTYFNSLGAVSVVSLYAFIVVKAVQWKFNIDFWDTSSLFYVPLFKNSFMALTGTLSLAYFIHNCIITIMQGNKYQENNVRDLLVAFIMVASTYIPIGLLFYSTFPLPKFCIEDNFFDNFSPHDTAIAVMRGFLFFQMFTVYPLLSYFVRTQVFSYMQGSDYIYSFHKGMLLNSIIMGLCILVAMFFPNIGFIIRWIGSVAGLAYIFVMPSLLYMYGLFLQDKLSFFNAIFHILIIVLGISNFLSQFFL